MNYIDPQRASVLAALYESGASIRQAAASARCAKKTVERYFKAFKDGKASNPYAAQASAGETADAQQECSPITPSALWSDGKRSLQEAPQSPWQPIETASMKREDCILVWDEECFPYPILAYWDDGYREVRRKRVLADKPRWRPVEDELEQYADCQGGLLPDWWLPWSPPPKAKT